MNATQNTAKCTHCESANVRTTDDDGDPCSPWCGDCGHRPTYPNELREKLQQAHLIARASKDS